MTSTSTLILASSVCLLWLLGFMPALAVVVTLIYLAKQIRQNTHAMEEGRRLALAQTYQMRSDALQAMLVQAADSDHIGPIIIKLTELGYPEDVKALDELTDADEKTYVWSFLDSKTRSFIKSAIAQANPKVKEAA